jgi:hypothetical protein
LPNLTFELITPERHGAADLPDGGPRLRAPAPRYQSLRH